MFSYKHYVPILRWKKAEQDALLMVEAHRKIDITPLIELVPLPARKKDQIETKTKEEVLLDAIKALPEKIIKIWGNEHIFLDLSYVDVHFQNEAVSYVFSITTHHAHKIVPVFRLNSDAAVINGALPYVRNLENRICLRLLSSDIENPNLHRLIDEFLTNYGFDPEHTDLLLDLQIVTTNIGSRVEAIIEIIPYLSRWRNFILSCGAFPKDMSQFSPNDGSKHQLPRTDWSTWFSLITSPNNKARLPSYADYTIQHPIFSDTSTFLPSANIRYTSSVNWVIMRGRSLVDHGYEQYLGLARLLTKVKDFAGKNFSKGDQYIADKGNDMNAKGTGNPTTWLRAGINHHISFVVDQIKTTD